MAKAEELASGNWRCRAYYTNENGKSVSKSFTAPTKKEAQYQAAAFKMEKKRKKTPITSHWERLLIAL